MTLLSHDRYCDEILAQTGLIRALVRDADLATDVPTCPGWTLDTLVRHIGGKLRTVGTAVRTGEAVDRPEEQVSDLNGPAGDDPATLDAWFAEGIDTYVEAMRKAGPEGHAQVWGIPWSTLLWVRRGVHDVLIHRADATLAVGADYTVEPDLAADAVDELLELFTGLQAMGVVPALTELRGVGKNIRLSATDTGDEWFIHLGPEGFEWRRGLGEAADVTLRGSLTDVLLAFYRRRPVSSGRVEVLGNAALLGFWLERVSLV
jgi:uncharacterized protein (TIGR03083 family)